MKNVFHTLHHHVVHHIRKHHKKYLVGVFGGFAVVKLFALVLWLSVVEYTNTSTFAQLASGCVLTGQYYTGEYQTWGYLTGQELTWGTLTDCTTIPWYWTGGSLDESGVLTGQIWIDAVQTGCVLDVLPIQGLLKQEILNNKLVFYHELVSVDLEILFGICPFRDLLSEIHFL